MVCKNGLEVFLWNFYRISILLNNVCYVSFLFFSYKFQLFFSLIATINVQLPAVWTVHYSIKDTNE